MSKAIPPVRKWRVRYWWFNVRTGKVDACFFEATVDAPTKQFAKWNARTEYWGSGAWRRVSGDCRPERITVSLAKVQS